MGPRVIKLELLLFRLKDFLGLPRRERCPSWPVLSNRFQQGVDSRSANRKSFAAEIHRLGLVLRSIHELDARLFEFDFRAANLFLTAGWASDCRTIAAALLLGESLERLDAAIDFATEHDAFEPAAVRPLRSPAPESRHAGAIRQEFRGLR
jgi:hypothetical protein